MKKMKKWLTVAGLVLCAQSPLAQDKSITIWWAQWDPAVGLQKLGDEFAAETGIGVKVHQMPWASYSGSGVPELR